MLSNFTVFPVGKNCEVDKAPCASHPCKKGGVCHPSLDYTSYTCRCPTGWQGMLIFKTCRVVLITFFGYRWAKY